MSKTVSSPARRKGGALDRPTSRRSRSQKFLGLGLLLTFAGGLLSPARASSSRLSSLPSRSPKDSAVEVLSHAFASDGEELVKTAAARLLVHLGQDPASAWLREVLVQAPGGLWIYEDALRGLAQSPFPGDLQALIQGIRQAGDRNHRAKHAAVSLEVDPETSLPVVHAHLKDPAMPREARMARLVAGPAKKLGKAKGWSCLVDAYSRYGADPSAGAALASALVGLDAAQARKLFLASLESPRWTLRKSATGHAAWFGDPAIVAALRTRYLEDPREEVRLEAVPGLLRWDPMGLAPLARARLEEARSVEELRVQIEALGRLGDSPAAPLLRQFYREATGTLKIAAIQSLALLQDPEVFPSFVETLSLYDAEDPGWIRSWTARALFAYGDSPGVAVLGASLRKDPVSYVQEGAASSLARIGSPRARGQLLESLRGPYPELTRVLAARSLAGVPEAIPALVEAFRSESAASVREALVASLGHPKASDEVGLVLEEALFDAAPGVVRQALVRLKARAPWVERAQRQAMVLLADLEVDEALRQAAADLLTLASSDESLDALEAAALGDPSAKVRGQAQAGLAPRDPERSLAVHLQVLEADPDPLLRLRAAGRVGQSDPEAGFEVLRRAVLRDTDKRVRRAAVLGLAPLLGLDAIDPQDSLDLDQDPESSS